MLSEVLCFQKAVPVWASGRESEMNLSLMFEAEIPEKLTEAEIWITASCSYILFLNGSFVQAGPARCAKGFFRVDRFPIKTEADGKNILSVLVAGYNVNSYQFLDQTSFLCAEVKSPDGETILYTDAEGAGGFSARVYMERLQRVQRFSIQRTFTEIYDYNRSRDDRAALSVVPAGTFLERGVPAADFSVVPFTDVIASGTFEQTKPERKYMNAINVIGPHWKGYPMDELERCSVWEAEAFSYKPVSRFETKAQDIAISENSYVVLDLQHEKTGMIELDVSCKQPVRLYGLFDEILTDQDPNNVCCTRIATSGLVSWDLPAGTYHLFTFEPYSLRYLKLCVLGGACTVEKASLRTYQFREIRGERLSDPALQKVYDAAIETFRQNVVDIYMDCPSRERAGWLCDSYFTAQAEYKLTGKSEVERSFLENFLLTDEYRHIPDGMLPMCYPSDFYDGQFIPNWAMFYVLELKGYLDRSGDSDMVEKAREKLYRLLDYFRPFENEYGLLEGLKGSVFVEWSKANEFLWDVNFPTNFLYAAMKKTMGVLYHDDALYAEGEALSRVAGEMSFDGRFFRDHAVRRDGKLTVSGECTEVCQYYAFYFDAADPEKHAPLLQVLLRDFGPQRKQTGLWPEIYFANAFIGNLLRLDLLKRFGYEAQMRQEIQSYYGFMAERTGTLWELDSPRASCNHGFASYITCLLSER